MKTTEAVVHAYAHLVAESGTNLPDVALPYPKQTIRDALVIAAATDSEKNHRERLCVLYGLLEDFLPHDQWKILHKWDRIITTRDTDALLQAPALGGEVATRLQRETTERGARRMDEFRERLRQVGSRSED